MESIHALSYEEPDIISILILSSFLFLLNVVNSLLDKIIYCGLIGQILVGVAWGLPGAGWLSLQVQHTIMQFGYLGLILIVYEGGLSISVTALRANIHLSVLVALTGISAPIALSFVLTKMLEITSLQAFAAGAALCSTSLGTTFTILSTSGLSESRLGTILSSAAMLDDVVGLIMVQVISNLGTSASSFSAITVVRPVFVSLAFAVVAPLVCCYVVRPIAIKIQSRDQTATRNRILTARWLSSSRTALLVHTLVLAGFVAGSSYAGTSNLFAAYLAGACIGWFDLLDVEVEQRLGKSSKISDDVPFQTVGDPMPESNQVLALDASSRPSADSVQNIPALSSGLQPSICNVHDREKADSPKFASGMAIYGAYYAPAVQSILKPFFFASIGFSIPITQMFAGPIVWRGIVYTILMLLGKLICGLWLIRFANLPSISTISQSMPLPKFTRKKRQQNVTRTNPTPESGPKTLPSNQQDGNTSTIPPAAPPQLKVNAPKKLHSHPANDFRIPKPLSLYPSAMLGTAMCARGEIGFLISSLAESTGIFASPSSSSSSSTTSTSGEVQQEGGGRSSELFLIVMWAVLLCTIIGPLGIGVMVKRVRRLQTERKNGGDNGNGGGREDPLGVWGVG